MGDFTRIMITENNARQNREKSFVLFVSDYGEKALTKNVNFSNVLGLLEIVL